MFLQNCIMKLGKVSRFLLDAPYLHILSGLPLTHVIYIFLGSDSKPQVPVKMEGEEMNDTALWEGELDTMDIEGVM